MTIIEIVQFILIVIIADRQLIVRERVRIGIKIHRYYKSYNRRFQLCWYRKTTNGDDFFYDGEICGFEFKWYKQ